MDEYHRGADSICGVAYVPALVDSDPELCRQTYNNPATLQVFLKIPNLVQGRCGSSNINLTRAARKEAQRLEYSCR
jgi:hypothetical protein